MSLVFFHFVINLIFGGNLQLFLFFFNGSTLAALYLQVHIQNATIAGGVAAGSVANLRLGPTGAIVVGACAGMLAVAGYKFITVRLLTVLCY